MLKLSPTTASGLSHTTYSLNLPEGTGLNLGVARPRQSSRALSGEMVYSLWPAKVSGLETSVDISVSADTYATLRAMAEHATVTEWVLQAHGRTFQVGFDITSAVPVRRFGQSWWSLRLAFYVVSELNR